MKAYVLENIGKLEYKDIPIPECPEGWALVKVKAAGICSSDIPRIFTKGTYHFPTIPGHEFSGVVEKTGSGEDGGLVGKRVGIFPLIPCRECESCAEHRYEMCEHYDYVGSRRDGGFAEYVLVPVWNLIELPESVSFEAAAMMEPLAVAYHALRQGIHAAGQPLRGKSVGIVGTGMIAFAGAQWARKIGAARIAVIGRTEEKRKIAERFPGVDYILQDDLQENGSGLVTPDGTGFDLAIEMVGSTEAVNRTVRLAKAGGTVVLMGNPYGNIEFDQNTYWRILRKQLRIAGTWNSSYEKDAPCEWQEVREALVNHEIEAETLITHTFPAEQLPDGLALMRAHKEPYCKVMTIWM